MREKEKVTFSTRYRVEPHADARIHTHTRAQTVGLSPPLRVMHDRSAENLCLCRERGDDPFIRYQNMEILLR